MLETVSKNGVEIFSTGVHNGDKYTRADLEAIVSAFNELGFEPIVKAGHEPGQEKPGMMEKLFGAPSLGYVKALRVVGDKLLADLKDIPKRFANVINAGGFKKISPEIFFDLKDEATGKIYPRVLRAIAFLGAALPAVTNLKDIEMLYRRGNGAVVKSYEFEIRKDDFMEAQTTERVSMSQASFAATEQVRAYAQENKMSFRDAARKVFAESAQAPGATQHLGALISGAIAAGDMALAVKIANSMPALARDAASECLLSEAKRIASSEGMTGMTSENMSRALPMAMKQYPDVASMQVGGSVTEATLKVIFSQWFKS